MTKIYREKVKTYFASPERLPLYKTFEQYHEIRTNRYIQEILNALPDMAFVLNAQRQVIFSNDVFLEKNKVTDISKIIGNRPGELFHCINHDTMKAGCGTSSNCKYCGAVGAFLESRKKNKKISRESSVITRQNGREVHLDLMITVTPFRQDVEEYTLLIINDISDEKRRRALERLFFHDLLNIAGGLKGLIDLTVKNDRQQDSSGILKTMKDSGERLVEEICFQSDLLAAENGEMRVECEMHSSLDIIDQAVQQIMYHNVAREKKIVVDPQSFETAIQTDLRLLKRVLVNMIKNALEAIGRGEGIAVGCYRDNQRIDFVVSNPGYMEEEVRAQLFQRSFSTKGSNRGIGTYSMKMFVEQYLGGSLSFATSKKKGTSFKASFQVS